jgi:hypothetical protein
MTYHFSFSTLSLRHRRTSYKRASHRYISHRCVSRRHLAGVYLTGIHLRPRRHMLILSLLLALLLVLLILLVLLVVLLFVLKIVPPTFLMAAGFLISDIEILDRDRRALGLAYTPKASRRGKDGSEIVLGISPCRPGRRDA